MASTLDLIQQRLQNLEQDNANLRIQLETTEITTHRERRRTRLQRSLALVTLIGAIFVSPANRHVLAQGYGITLQQLAARLTVVESKDAQQDATLASLQTQIQNISLTPGPKGSKGDKGDKGDTGPAGTLIYKSFIVLPDGTTPGTTGVSVSHTANSGTYNISFPAGSFPGFSTPIVNVLGNGGRIVGQLTNSNGSLSFTVVNPGGDQIFNVVILPFR